MIIETEETSRRSRVEGEITSMLRDHRFDGLVARLNARLPGHRELAADAACEAVARVLEQIERSDVRSVPAYMYQVALNYMKKELKKRLPREVAIEDLDGFDPAHDEEPDELFGAELLRMLKKVTMTWNDNIRVITNLVLDHTARDDYDWMTAEDLAQEATAILGVEILAQNASMWKSRGLARLRDHFSLD